MDAAKDAPGVNDDGSGTALVLEAARVLSQRKFAGTIVYVSFCAIRITVGIANYDYQHHDPRVESDVSFGDTPQFMDFAYLAKVTQLNIATQGRLAAVPMPPAFIVNAAVSSDTTLEWPNVPGAGFYRIYRRPTNAADWGRTYAGKTAVAALLSPSGKAVHISDRGGRGDDWLIGVSAAASDGLESPITSALPGGLFARLH